MGADVTGIIDTYDIREASFLDCIGGLSATGSTVDPVLTGPTFDGVLSTVGRFINASSGNGVITGGSFGKLTTTKNHDYIIVAVAVTTDTDDLVNPVVSSITSTTGLIFTRIGGGTFTNTPLSQQQGIELWGAWSTRILTNEDLTITLSAVADNVAWGVLPFHGTRYGSPLDPNGALPGFDGETGPTSITISTTTPNDAIVWAAGNEGVGASNYPSGFTVPILNFLSSGGGSGNIVLTMGYLLVSAVQTSLLLQPVADANGGVAIVTAIQGN